MTQHSSYFTCRVLSSASRPRSSPRYGPGEIDFNLKLFNLVGNDNIQQLKQFAGHLKLHARNEKGMTLIHMAVACQSMEVLRFLLEDGSIPINAQDDKGNTAIHLAVKAGNTEAMTMLLEKGANDAIKNNKDEPPLHLLLERDDNCAQLAVFLKYPVCIQIKGKHGYSTFHVIVEKDNTKALELIYQKAISEKCLTQHDFCSHDDNGTSALHLAAMKGSHRVLDFMLSKMIESGVPSNDVLHHLDERSNTPLHTAVEHGHKQVVDVLLKHGASPTIHNKNNLPPCHLACAQNKLDIVVAMVEACGAEILHSLDAYGCTPLHSCSRSISDELFSYIVDSGADLSAQDIHGNTPLHTSVLHGNALRVELLLSKGVDSSIANKYGYNALHLSIKFHRREAFKALIRSQCATTLCMMSDKENNFPVHLAVKHGFGEAVPTLMSLLTQSCSDQSNSEIQTIKDSKGNNFLHSASEAGDTSSVSYLLTLPCSRYLLNCLNTQGFTPLHCAACSGSASTLQELIDHGAIEQQSYCGNTPFMLACLYGNLEAATLLHENSPFSKNVVNCKGETALHLSAKSGNVQLVLMCLDQGLSITLSKSHESFFDLLMKETSLDVVRAILKHDRWEECLDICSPDLPHPVLRIIESIPEAFQVILDRSVTYSTLNPLHSDYWEEYNFKYLTLTNESVSQPEYVATTTSKQDTVIANFVSSAQPEIQKQDSVETTANKDCIQPHSSFKVLKYLIKYRHKSYLTHPVTNTFLNLKWRRYALPYYIFRFFLFLLFTILLSSFILVTPPPEQFERLVNITAGSSDTQRFEFGIQSTVFRFLTLGLGIPNLVLWMLDLYIKGSICIKHFFAEYEIWMHGLSLLFTFIYTIPWQGLNHLFWEVGAIAAFLAWFTVAIDLQLFSWVGIFVTMMLTVTRNVIGVLLIAFIMICAFAFPLYVLVGTVTDLTYTTIGHSLFSILASLLAEINYETFQMLDLSSQLRYSTLTFLFLCLLTIFMPIVVINLLIGLAVGDIAKIQEEAIISQRTTDVQALVSLDKQFPKWLLNKFFQQTVRHYPNKGVILKLKKIFYSLWNGSDEQASTSTNTTINNDSSYEVLSKEYHSKIAALEISLNKVITEQNHQQKALQRIEDMLHTLTSTQQS